jgi:hypothetical protein
MKISFSVLLLVLFMVLTMDLVQAQDLRCLRVGALQSYFSADGAENELVSLNTSTLAWPAQYGDNQHTTRMQGLWMGAEQFYDPVEKKLKSVKVIGSGPRNDAINQPGMIFSQSIKLIGKSAPPVVTVDGKNVAKNKLYDVVDEIDPTLPSDRMIVNTFHTSIGVSVTRKVMAFTQQNHDNYFIQDYVFTNTGIYDQAGDINKQTLNNFYVYFTTRNAFAGVTSTGFGSTWGDFSSEWGASTVYYDFGNPYRPLSDGLRGYYSFYTPMSGGARAGLTSYAQDWGCPNQQGGGENLNGVLGSAKYTGVVTLSASKSPSDWSDDSQQPRTTAYNNSDEEIMKTPYSQYDTVFMQKRYKWMREGHLPKSMWEDVGDGNFVLAFWISHQSGRYGGTQGQGFGPYTLAPGDSIHIVVAEGVGGISWEKCREVGANWYEYYKGTSTPPLHMPDGSTNNSYTAYTRAWVETGKDSILKTFRNALANYKSAYKIPPSPPAPNRFDVLSGGNHISLAWSNNAETDPHFGGYVLYRSAGSVKDYKTVYEKILECDKRNLVNEYDDTTGVPGVGYYYFIQSKDDGTQNDLHPGTPLSSSKFLTMTGAPAMLTSTSVNGLPSQIPDKFSLMQNYPNPFNPTTTISFSLPKKSFVTLTIHDAIGRVIATMVSEELAAGTYQRQWNAAQLSSGVYWYELKAGSDVETKKLVLIK